MVDSDVNKTAGLFLEIPSDLHTAGRVQRRFTMDKVQLSIGRTNAKLRNPGDVNPRADTRILTIPPEGVCEMNRLER